MNRLTMTLLATSLLASATATAQTTISWDLPGDGNWNVTGNWTPTLIPNNDDHAIIDHASNPTVFVDSETVDQLTIGAGNTLSINNARIFAVNAVDTPNSGLITNNGTILLNSSGNNTYFRPFGGTVSLLGSGVLECSPQTANWIYEVSGGSLLNGPSHTIRGAANLGWNTTPFENQGTVEAIYAAPMTVDADATGMTNTGTMRAKDGGVLQLAAGVYTNTGGLIEAQDASEVQLIGSSHVIGGTIQATGTGIIRTTTGTAKISDLTIASGAVQSTNSSILEIAGVINNLDTISVASIGNNTYLRPVDGPVTLQGGGTIEFSDAPANWFYELAGGSIVNVDNTIRGACNLGWNTTPFENQALIEAIYTNPMIVDADATGFRNSGTMRATNGGVLRFAPGAYDNTGGLIEAQTGSRVELSGAAVITGGTLQTSGTGEFHVVTSSPKLVDLSVAGDIIVDNARILEIAGAVQNTGTIKIDGIGNNTYLRPVDGPVTLTGGGTIEFSDQSANWFYELAGGSIVNQDNTIRGSVNLGWNTTPFENYGTIHSDGTVGITLDPAGTELFLNAGTLRSSGTGNLAIAAGLFDQAGDFLIDAGATASAVATDFRQSAGRSQIDGTFTFTQTFRTFYVDGGTLTGTGIIEGDVRVENATVEPGASPGTLTITRDLTVEDGSTLKIELGGLTAGSEHDQLVVSGDAFFEGILEVELVNGYVPNQGDSFLIVDGGTGMTATFTREIGVNLPNGLGVRYEVDEANNDLYLVVETSTGAPEVGTGIADLRAPLEIRPNPAPAGRTQIAFQLKNAAGHADVAIYDLAGRRVRQIASGAFDTNARIVEWDGRDESGRSVAAGIYFARLVSDTGLQETKRVTVLR